MKKREFRRSNKQRGTLTAVRPAFPVAWKQDGELTTVLASFDPYRLAPSFPNRTLFNGRQLYNRAFLLQNSCPPPYTASGRTAKRPTHGLAHGQSTGLSPSWRSPHAIKKRFAPQSFLILVMICRPCDLSPFSSVTSEGIQVAKITFSMTSTRSTREMC